MSASKSGFSLQREPNVTVEMSEHEQWKFVSGSHLWFGKVDIGMKMNMESIKATLMESILMLHEGFPKWRSTLALALPWKPPNVMTTAETALYRGNYFDTKNLEKAKVIKIWLGMLENMGIPLLGEEMTIKQEQV